MKKTLFLRITCLLLAALLLILASCSAAPMNNGNDGGYDYMDNLNRVEVGVDGIGADDFAPEETQNESITEEESPFLENPFIATAENNVSTFSADVDTASYTYFRKLVNAGYTWEALLERASTFRTEEFINYFSYHTHQPTQNELFAVDARVLPCPWNNQTALLRMTLQAENAIPTDGNNLVFLIDVSGSMSSDDKLPLLKQAFGYLVDNLRESDVISIVTYSGNEAVILDGCAGNKRETILEKIESLSAKGSTNGEAGLQKAYELAKRHFIEGGNNRIIMASDGDLNVGISSSEELKAYVSQKRTEKIYLSVLGFGTGNYRDANMEALADNGNGVYYYVDGASEAERIFSSALLGTLYTIAEDVKLQITFDPQHIASYRLIGYENRMLRQEDFTDDTKDAGEVGAGHQVTVCYEITFAATADPDADAWMALAVNYKKPGESTSCPPQSYPIGALERVQDEETDDLFIASLIKLCMLLHQSRYLPQGYTLQALWEELEILDLSASPERAEYKALIRALIENTNE